MPKTEEQRRKQSVNRRNYMTRPKGDESQRAKRPCIRCRKKIDSRHRGHRMCSECRAYAEVNSHLVGTQL